MPDYYVQLRAGRNVVHAGARALRSRAIQDGYAGLEHKATAFGFALILDELSRHWGQGARTSGGPPWTAPRS